MKNERTNELTDRTESRTMSVISIDEVNETVNLNKINPILDAAAAPLVLHDDLRDHGGSRHAAQGLQPPPRQERAPPASPAAPAHPAATQTSPQNIRHEGQ